MKKYVIRLGSCRGDGLYLVHANDFDVWTFTNNQRKATRVTSLYAADVTAEGIGDARVVRVRRRKPNRCPHCDRECGNRKVCDVCL